MLEGGHEVAAMKIPLRVAFWLMLVAMSLGEHVPLVEVKNRLSEVVDWLNREHGRVVITKDGRPAAVVLSIDDLESLEETLEILSSEDLVGEIKESLAELRGGGATVMTKREALAEIASH
jgi:prevent-host-death family protein